MQKFTAAIMVTMAALLGFGTVASAYPPDYPPASTPIDPTDAELPVTGSDGVSSIVFVALILLAAGIGLFVTAQARRRQQTA